MKHIAPRRFLCLAAMAGLWVATATAQHQRQELYLEKGWRFSHSDDISQSKEAFDDRKWQQVSVPHDWAIAGPFDKEIDKQTIAIEQNMEKEATEKTGRSGALPWIGVGWYRTRFAVERDCGRAILNFDGAMAEPQVYINGLLAGEWKYGYSAFNIDITPFVHKDGRLNTLAVRTCNEKESSRWYPGAGLYRPVKLITTGAQALDEWGVDVKTLRINTQAKTAEVLVEVKTTGCETARDYAIGLETVVGGRRVEATRNLPADGTATFTLHLDDVEYWSPETPRMYAMDVSLIEKKSQAGAASCRVADSKTVKFGVRTIEVGEGKGFALNGVGRKIKGVCLHHDLGMMGAAVNRAALAHQLNLLKSMGCDAVRTSHNMPSQWQMELCDSLGIMVMAESFDMWLYPKVKNGYNRYYADWWERDLTNLVLANRLHPSIVMWSIGNEIPEQSSKDGAAMTRRMQGLIHQLDDTRPVTAGMDRIDNALATGYAQVLDVPGMNYRTGKYEMAHGKLRHGFVLGSETASTVSSRGVYKFPVEYRRSFAHPDGQCSSYDVECCTWSNLPEDDWVLQDDNPWVIGEFVWTGFDYLGEPTPYNTDLTILTNFHDEEARAKAEKELAEKGAIATPSRSSYFGIIDLAGFPKDRYWLYKSRWSKEPVLHLMPHWNWAGREGLVTPVQAYTNCVSAELFVNGKSYGIKTKGAKEYRFLWDDVVYEPGTVKVVGQTADGQTVESTVSTTGSGARVLMAREYGRGPSADFGGDCPPAAARAYSQEDLIFVDAKIADLDGNIVPTASDKIKFSVSGAGEIAAVDAGDATCHTPFHSDEIKAFGGLASVIVRRTGPGVITLKAESDGLEACEIKL